MTGQIQADSYVLGLCKEFGIIDKNGEKNNGVENRISTIAKKFELRVLPSETSSLQNVSFWSNPAHPIVAALKSLAKRIYFVFHPSMKKAEAKDIQELYSKVIGEQKRLKEKPSIKKQFVPVSVDKLTYENSLSTLSDLLIAMVANEESSKKPQVEKGSAQAPSISPSKPTPEVITGEGSSSLLPNKPSSPLLSSRIAENTTGGITPKVPVGKQEEKAELKIGPEQNQLLPKESPKQPAPVETLVTPPPKAPFETTSIGEQSLPEKQAPLEATPVNVTPALTTLVLKEALSRDKVEKNLTRINRSRGASGRRKPTSHKPPAPAVPRQETKSQPAPPIPEPIAGDTGELKPEPEPIPPTLQRGVINPLAAAAAGGRFGLRRVGLQPKKEESLTTTPPATPLAALRPVAVSGQQPSISSLPTPQERLRTNQERLVLTLPIHEIDQQLLKMVNDLDLTKDHRATFRIAFKIIEKGAETSKILNTIFGDPNIDPFKLLFLADTLVVGLKKPELQKQVVGLLETAFKAKKNERHLEKVRAYLNSELTKREPGPLNILYIAIMSTLPPSTSGGPPPLPPNLPR
jgi:hypothetical protein